MSTIKDKDDFTAAYDKFADAIFRHCYFRVSDREKAKDLMQEVFVRTWNYIVDGNEIKELKSFLYRTAHNLIVDEYRTRKNDASLEELRYIGFDSAEDAREKLYARVDAKEILSLLDRLDPKHREVVIMRYIDDLGPKEISEITGESQNTISVRINRAIEQAKKLLEK